MTGTLTAADLTVRSGTWSGLLFENPGIGYGPALTWTFDVGFADVTSPGGTTITPGLTVDWVPLSIADWDHVAPKTVSCDRFAEPIETSLYCFDHCRYDAVRLDLHDQRGTQLHARIAVRGDIDSLGIDELTVDTPLTFTGIRVALPSVGSIAAARATLQTFTNAATLVGRDAGSGYDFVPAGS